ncbi:AraC family transcriptional regulator ligand-binding domain-containing protein [Thalassotalea psychrophila]|uniref:AraC family transcriptional regulator ligand-binding domain-containing protein n=1 Tax=Thalassotalea psychrophila TaxID=3065647 RepID=A0ABY9TZ32_9GAMM|nr:AraC family transcriptional regulator ligand-binding domain-containing protein [Colwelliaceae bacterium SQ149]
MQANIFVVRAAHIKPIIKILEKLKIDTNKLLQQVGLNQNKIESEHKLVLEAPVWKLLEIAAKELAMPHLGFYISEQLSLDKYGVFGAHLCHAENLQLALNTFIKNINTHTNYLNYWLEQDDNFIWVCRQGTPGIEFGKWQVEQHIIGFIIEIIKIYTGDKWYPQHLHIQDKLAEGLEYATGLTKSTLKTNQPYTVIAVEKALLTAKPSFQKIETSTVDKLEKVIPHGFINIIEVLMKQGYFDEDLNATTIAKVLNIPERKLQRRLKQYSTTLNYLINEHKHSLAKTMLKKSIFSNEEISKHLGYSNVANFYRAFKLQCGQTPKQFKKIS